MWLIHHHCREGGEDLERREERVMMKCIKNKKNVGNVVLLATIKKLAKVNLSKFKVHLNLRQGKDHHKSQPVYTSLSHSNQMLLKYKQHP
ncbi:hypothetical protein GIB67_013731 [Kingdonia uniflora]|uniref:Uncharacterized protein n=1 Tax=Kingdonia uniflora TaxID=39325 RepID=A0A7J7NQ36_9MAGN|nr:hypothetical protein GIB67_013731 [Kingdonia uniflora]